MLSYLAFAEDEIYLIILLLFILGASWTSHVLGSLSGP